MSQLDRETPSGSILSVLSPRRTFLRDTGYRGILVSKGEMEEGNIGSEKSLEICRLIRKIMPLKL